MPWKERSVMDEQMRFVIRLKDGAAVPEVVRNGILVEPESAEALAAAIVRLYRSPDLRHSLASAACRDVEHFDVHRIARVFLSEVAKVAPGIAAPVSDSNVDAVTLGGRVS